MKKIFLPMIFMFPTPFLMSSSLEIQNTDIIERFVNFIIFVVLLWYLVAGKIKEMLNNRTLAISNKFNEVQTEIEESANMIKDVDIRLKEAREYAQEIINTAKKEAIIMVHHVEEQNKEQIAYLIKNNEEMMFFKKRKMEKELISEALKETFSVNNLKFSSHDYLEIIQKKVS